MLTENIILAIMAVFWATLVSMVTLRLLANIDHRAFLDLILKRFFVAVTLFSAGGLLALVDQETWSRVFEFLSYDVFVVRIAVVSVFWLLAFLFLFYIWRSYKGVISS